MKDRIYLARFYYRASRNLEETKLLIEANYHFRSKHPNVFFNRDPDSDSIQQSTEFFHMVTLPGLTTDNSRVTLVKLKSTDANMMHHIEDVKYLFTFYDYRVSLPDVVENGKPYIVNGVIQIVDMKGITMRHAAKTSFTILAAAIKYLQKCCPSTLKGLHLVNCPSYINRLFAW
ncbi:uncharacterized protein LOC106091356 [Stomoxys calcitrans]|nr:uncharacterized protein LOC106091356 [Stomoxys calcitrans]